MAGTEDTATLASGEAEAVALAEAFRTGSVEALAAVFDRYSGTVWTVAMSVLRDRALADDATQETFMRAWKSAASLSSPQGMVGWLVRIAQRTALDVRRREARPTQGGHAAEPEAHDPRFAETPRGVEGAWEAWQIRCALDALPPEEREVVRLAHYGQLTHSEIATSLGVPAGTVKSRSHRAHRRLATALRHLRAGEREGGTR